MADCFCKQSRTVAVRAPLLGRDLWPGAMLLACLLVSISSRGLAQVVAAPERQALASQDAITTDSATADSTTADSTTAVRRIAYSHPQAEQIQARRDLIADLILQLGDENYQTRKAARWRLEQIGLEAFEQLQKARSHPNYQIEQAATYLVESQDVVWYLDTDSSGVRLLLDNYNRFNEERRATCYQQLAELERVDAFLALARLARFEVDPTLARSAALRLMEQVRLLGEERPSELDGRTGRFGHAFLMSLERTVGDSQRDSVRWILTLASDLRQFPPPPLARQTGSNRPSQSYMLPAAAVERWRVLSEELDQGTSADDERRGRLVAARFYQWLGKWLSGRVDPLTAQDLARPWLKIASRERSGGMDSAEWILEAKLPGLLQELASSDPARFEESPELQYLLAESFQQTGDEAQAQTLAAAASDAFAKLVRDRTAGLNDAPSLSEIEASLRFSAAKRLESRGIYAWAEREYARALECKPSLNLEWQVRVIYAFSLWEGTEFAAAAAVLEPLVDRIESPEIEVKLSNANMNEKLLSDYHFYAGLASSQAGKTAEAAAHLIDAYETEAGVDNPDIVIALKRLSDEQPFQSYYRVRMDSLVEELRSQIATHESLVSSADARSVRRSASETLAEYCNQLAWLLANCEENTPEAVTLSLRSLELSPDTPAFLDTLGRCLFANRQYPEAVEIQRRAIALSPHKRQFYEQLSLFEAALDDLRPDASQGFPADAPEPSK